MKKIRRLHLWIGLFTSILILMEAVTGLLMVEPWLAGVNKPSPGQRAEFEKPVMKEVSGEGAARIGVEAGGHFAPDSRGNSIMAFVKNLHAGRVGDTNVSFLLDIVAVGLIILTITGIILSIKALKK
ncbi:MAG: PepSY domain-containing protein [Peptococcaceae bacterium]|nr:PepSY domain-containing protein [Peptococcaceae bacterium]